MCKLATAFLYMVFAFFVTHVVNVLLPFCSNLNFFKVFGHQLNIVCKKQNYVQKKLSHERRIYNCVSKN